MRIGIAAAMIFAVFCVSFPRASLAAEPLAPCSSSEVPKRLDPKALTAALRVLETTAATACQTACARCYDARTSQDGTIRLSVKGVQGASTARTEIEVFVVVDPSTGKVLRSAAMFLIGAKRTDGT